MYDGKQVLRVEKYKSSDLYNIWKEMQEEYQKERKGTGNYDIERTPFNVKYVDVSERNLYQEVKTVFVNLKVGQKLQNRN